MPPGMKQRRMQPEVHVGMGRNPFHLELILIKILLNGIVSLMAFLTTGSRP